MVTLSFCSGRPTTAVGGACVPGSECSRWVLDFVCLSCGCRVQTNSVGCWASIGLQCGGPILNLAHGTVITVRALAGPTLLGYSGRAWQEGMSYRASSGIRDPWEWLGVGDNSWTLRVKQKEWPLSEASNFLWVPHFARSRGGATSPPSSGRSGQKGSAEVRGTGEQFSMVSTEGKEAEAMFGSVSFQSQLPFPILSPFIQLLCVPGLVLSPVPS